MDVVLRHRTASGVEDTGLWELDQDGKIIASIRIASGPLVPVSYTHLDVYKRQARTPLP